LVLEPRGRDIRGQAKALEVRAMLVRQHFYTLFSDFEQSYYLLSQV